VAVHAGAGKRVHVVAIRLPAIVAALERYVGEPLPLRKLDLVGVPEFFGAMENPGLITFEERMLIGGAARERLDYFTHIAAHELAHQWFGNTVTPAWWDDLWLSESFASWLGDKVTRELGSFGDGPLRDVLERREALAADTGPRAIPLHRPIAVNTDPDEAFDAIAYQKGESVLATFEAFAGEDAFRDAVRDYVHAHRGGTATARDWIDALARATSADAGNAFEQYTVQVGAPVVDLALRCTGTAAVIASARDHRLVPACVRYPGARAPACALVGGPTEIALGATCPAWVDGNAAAGYYTVHWRDRPVTRWLQRLPATARAVAGDDLAAALERGELHADEALAALTVLLAGDEYARLGAAALAEQLDELVDDTARPAWTSWLARRLPRPGRTSGPGEAALVELRQRLPVDRAPVAEQRRARALVDRALRVDGPVDPVAVALAGVRGGDEVFDGLVTRARLAGTGEGRERWLALLGELPATYAERTARLAVDNDELPAAPLWHALARYLARPEARAAGWRALHAHLDTFVERAPDLGDEMIDAAAVLCDQTARDEVAQAFLPHLARIRDGRAHLDRALAAIDRCIARRAAFGDLGAVLESAHTHSREPCARRDLGARCRDEHR
jgi:alanyl aminopeptidase